MTAHPQSIVAVLGAGTMGAGIAQAAVSAGVRVLLHDASASAGAAVRACEKIGAAQAELVTKGKVHAADRDALLAHIRPVTTLAPATLVIEAIIENLSAKQDILRKVEEVGAEAILEANTSSLSAWSLQSV
jgi:3-hydroxybutyryl-CoA dehydrogenase